MDDRAQLFGGFVVWVCEGRGCARVVGVAWLLAEPAAMLGLGLPVGPGRASGRGSGQDRRTVTGGVGEAGEGAGPGLVHG